MRDKWLSHYMKACKPFRFRNFNVCQKYMLVILSYSFLSYSPMLLHWLEASFVLRNSWCWPSVPFSVLKTFIYDPWWSGASQQEEDQIPQRPAKSWMERSAKPLNTCSAHYINYNYLTLSYLLLYSWYFVQAFKFRYFCAPHDSAKSQPSNKYPALYILIKGKLK